MKTSKKLLIVILIIVVVILAIMAMRSGDSQPGTPDGSTVSAPTSEAKPGTAVAVSETTKVSASLSEYQNAELGFSVKYPSTWEREDANAGVSFIIPVDSTQVSTVATLQANIQALSGLCAFPPVTTVQSRETIKVGTYKFNMISMTNTVQSRVYSNRMYSLQQGDICYMFSFASIALSPSSKGLTGSNMIQAQNNNKAITSTADAAFTDMVKSFAIVTTPAGQDESTVAPVKK
jgi:hypothetical protein